MSARFVGAPPGRFFNRGEAAERFREVLQLDASDRQFAPYWLAASLSDLGQHDELKQLLAHYEEPTTLWRYAQSLWAWNP